jgi:N-acetylmuramoyl-L-alanine amidase
VVALVIGHDPKESGAQGEFTATDGTRVKVSEYPYNVVVSGKVRQRLSAEKGIHIHDVRRHLCGGYHGMVRHVNGIDPAFAVELHFNAADDPKANGTETLFWHASERSRELATIFQAAVITRWQLRDRGLKPINLGERGAPFLRGTRCPAIICEPFFGSNAKEMQHAMDRVDQLAAAYADAIVTAAEHFRTGRKA